MNKDGKKEILIVDDNLMNLSLLKVLISELSIDCIIYYSTNGKKAVDFCENNRGIDLILMDIKMPIMNGLDATIKIKKNLPKVPIIAQSIFYDKLDKELAYKAGCIAHLSKPYNIDILHSKLIEHLYGKTELCNI